MATSFFRGMDRADALFCVLLSNASTWNRPDEVRDLAAQFGYVGHQRYSFAGSLIPAVWVIITDEFVFVVSDGTDSYIQHLGNVLGAKGIVSKDLQGKVNSYFALAAQSQYAAYIDYMLDNKGTRKVVFVGFSLGAAAVTMERQLLQAREGVSSSLFAIASPRPGDATFAASVPILNTQRFQAYGDIVPSLAPSTWSEEGAFIGWVFYGTPIEYRHVVPGWTLYQPFEIRNGDQLQDPNDVIRAWNLNLWLGYHNQEYYAQILRRGLPTPIASVGGDFDEAENLDLDAGQLYPDWPWTQPPSLSVPSSSGALMNANVTLCFRLANGTGLGFQEDYIISAADLPTAQALFTPSSPTSIMNKRFLFMSNSIEYYALRVSEFGASRVGMLKKFASPSRGSLAYPVADIEDCISYFGYTADNAHKRQFHFRGCPDTWFQDSTMSPPVLTNQGLIEDWLAELKTKTLALKSRATTDDITFKVNAKANIGEVISLHMDAARNYPANSILNIKGCKAFPLLNGAWQTPGTGGVALADVSLNATETLDPPIGTTGVVGLAGRVANVALAVTRFEFNGVSSKKTGRELFLRRGRQSARFHHR